MRIVVVGASRFGQATTRQLLDKGHEVVLVDSDRSRLESLEEDLDCGMLHGDGSLPSIQRDAYGDHADALVLLTNSDDVNILAAAVGKSIGFERVLPQIVRGELISVCEELGLEDLIARIRGSRGRSCVCSKTTTMPRWNCGSTRGCNLSATRSRSGLMGLR